MESVENKGGMASEENKFNQDIYSKVVRAGKRTYFFDVKSTRNDEYYLTITESKKRFEDNGDFHYEKHKIFLYREDFAKFAEGLQEIVDYIKDHKKEEQPRSKSQVADNVVASGYSDVEFEDI